VYYVIESGSSVEVELVDVLWKDGKVRVRYLDTGQVDTVPLDLLYLSLSKAVGMAEKMLGEKKWLK